jgi:hypothetical protein
LIILPPSSLKNSSLREVFILKKAGTDCGISVAKQAEGNPMSDYEDNEEIPDDELDDEDDFPDDEEELHEDDILEDEDSDDFDDGTYDDDDDEDEDE